MSIRLSNGTEIPIEMHKVRIVQKVRLAPARERLKAIEAAGYNTFLLRTRDIFLDMLTDSGTNAMSDNQLAAMMQSDDAYAGSESFYKLADAVQEIFGYKYLLPTHQGRAAEHLLAKTFVKPGHIVPMNYHFTTTKAHFDLAGGKVLELYTPEALKAPSTCPFKGNMDLGRLRAAIEKAGAENVSFVRMEATTNLIGGQPFSLENLKQVKALIEPMGIFLVLDASLISENAYFIHQREPGYENASIRDIILEMMSVADLCYLSGRKSCSVRGGFIATNRKDLDEAIRPWLPLYEGFYTYGGMSSKEIEAMAVGMREMTELEVAGSSADAIKYLRGPAAREGSAGGHARWRAGLPRRRHAVHRSRAAVGVPGGRAGRRGVHRFGRSRHGARLGFHGSGRARQRRAGGHGAAAHGRSAARVHHVALPVRGRPPGMALPPPEAGRRASSSTRSRRCCVSSPA